MHEKYTTRGLIVSSSPYKEADKILSIYTEDFGLVSAVAAGVRRSHSKLRYHAQDYSVRAFSLVRGRDLWRFVGAEEIPGISPIDPVLSQSATEALTAYARVLSLIRRLVRGEERNEAVFQTLFSFYGLLSAKKSLADDSAAPDFLQTSEALAVFRILHDLGYIKSDTSTEPLITPAEIDPALVLTAQPLLSSLISAINSGLAESHL